MEKKTEKKTFELEIKELSEEGRFSGHLSTFGNVDAGGDIVEPGAFKKTLRDNKAFGFLWAHDGTLNGIIGSYHGEEDEAGLAINGGFYLDLDVGLKAYRTAKRLMKDGVKIGLSMGYRAVKYVFDTVEGATVRRLKEVKLHEGSITLWPMNEEARLEAVKEEGEEETETKPSAENHLCRVGSGSYVKYRSEKRNSGGKPYTVRYGITKAGKAEEYEYFYPVDSWTASQARAHCKDNDGSFEAATGKDLTSVCASCRAALGTTEPEDSTQPAPEPQKMEPDEFHSALEQIRSRFKK